ncbi:hypothetical protein IMZ48_29010 [Candidatus Bathyarchaeota archaeon]|nr:hypothetical protein [Candidatus Bathyarchaeota archaeon]
MYAEEMQWAVDEGARRRSHLAEAEAGMMAFIFLPMSLVDAVFGMNVKEL